ncbi:MAG TPA: hypothetical protein VK626_08220, partial [Nitrospiraceae bacterium]|nr:hypothetical protein [Nitrospiraceae bacterium]
RSSRLVRRTASMPMSAPLAKSPNGLWFRTPLDAVCEQFRLNSGAAFYHFTFPVVNLEEGLAGSLTGEE